MMDDENDPNFIPARPRDPEPVLELPAPMISKDDIWRRATDDEATQMWAALQSQPIRMQQIYAGATFISPDDELFGTLQAALVGLFGEDRAAGLLRRSN